MPAHFLGQKTIPKKRTNQIIVTKATHNMGVKLPHRCLNMLPQMKRTTRKGPCLQQSKATFLQIQSVSGVKI